jgi:hypothetical protein
MVAFTSSVLAFNDGGGDDESDELDVDDEFDEDEDEDVDDPADELRVLVGRPCDANSSRTFSVRLDTNLGESNVSRRWLV